MFLCLECDALFEIPVHYREYRGEYFGYSSYEEFEACPCCGGSYAKTYKCSCCGKWITNDYIKTDDDERYCSDCYQGFEIGEEE